MTPVVYAILIGRALSLARGPVEEWNARWLRVANYLRGRQAR